MFYEIHTHIDRERKNNQLSFKGIFEVIFLSVSTPKEFEALFSQDKLMSRI